MSSVLIGHTGFVGSTIAREVDFTHHFNSKNINDLAGQSVDLVVCAGVQAVKWWANKNPEADWEGIAPLLKVLETVTARKFVLISTVDVYAAPNGVNEDTPIKEDGLHPYGLHRRRVEHFVMERFAEHRIVRLPGLFGRGLKKNLIFDILNDGPLDGFHGDSTFQFYDLSRLVADLGVLRDAPTGVYNLAVPPVSVRDVYEQITGQPFQSETRNAPIHYDMQSKHMSLFGRDGRYLETVAENLARIGAFARAPS